MSVRLVLAAVLCALALGAAAQADDYGPPRDVRAARAAVPILMAARVRALAVPVKSIRVDDVVVSGDEAVADWSAGVQGGIVGLARRHGLWWISGEINRYEPEAAGERYWYLGYPGALPVCANALPRAAAPDNLAQELHMHSVTVTLAQAHIAAIAQDAARESAWRKRQTNGLVRFDGIDNACYPVGNRLTYLDTSSGYRGELMWASPTNLNIVRFTGRAPTQAEFPGTPGADAVYFFSLDIGGNDAHVVGATLDVWCPFVLDTHVRYSLTLAGAGPMIGPIGGTLRDNTLYFELPPFTATPTTSLMGEIDDV